MHILTLIMLSKMLKRGKQKSFKGFRGIVEIRHFIPGRIRFFIPSLKNNRQACSALEKQLSKAEVIGQVVVNPLTGSLLIVYKPGATDEATLTGVVVKLLGLEHEVEKTPQPLLGKELNTILKSLNTAVYEHSDGLLDLSDLVSLSFLSLGVYSLLRNPRMLPSGLSMIYWGYRTIVTKLPQQEAH